MNKLLIIGLLLFNTMLAYGQVINGNMWNYLPVISEQVQMYKGDGESLYNDVDFKNGMWTSQLYNIKKNNVEKMTIAFYPIVKKFGKPILSTEAYKGFQVTYHSDGRILRGGGSNLSLDSRIIPGGYTVNGADIKLKDNRTYEVIYSYNEKAIYEYNQNGYVKTIKYHSNYGSPFDKMFIFQYNYIPNSNKISSVVAYSGETAKEVGKVNYVYDGQKRLIHLYGNHIDAGKFEKKIKYDIHGNIAYLGFSEHSKMGDYRKQEYIYNNHYDEKGLLCKTEYQYKDESNSNNFSNSYSLNFVSCYKYDIEGNWVEVLTTDEQGVGECVKRLITYK